MRKYHIHPDFKELRFIKMPRSLFINKVGNFFLRLGYRLQKINSKATCTRYKLPVSDGEEINFDMITPKEKKIRPCLIYFPGGGFLMAATQFHKKIIADIAVDQDIAVAMVHYRLAPKYPFPTALNDAIACLEHLDDQALKYDIDNNRFAIGGDSAGGSLAAGVCLYARDRLNVKLRCAMLVYPATDDKETKSRKTYVDTPMFHSRMLPIIKKAYFANGHFDLKKYAFPMMHDKHEGLPPTYIETAEFDPLHDEGVNYAAKLKDNNVEVVLNETKGTVHGYDILSKSEIVKEAYARRKSFIGEHLK
ncbi:MAG: alpha/beta hydrolase [Candidatus Izemoplasmatales bacterium]|nr:alpha/beta hydrolase [Candidatus Izemoplasmatales bacterium]